MEKLFLYINLLAVYSLIISVVLIFKDRGRIRGAYAVLSFLVCVLIYLFIDLVSNSIVKMVLVIGPFLVPFAFWIMSRSLFNDESISISRTVVYAIGTTLIYYGFYYAKNDLEWIRIAPIGARAFSIFFIGMAIIEAQSGKRADLDDDRLRLRKYFTYFIGLIVLITILSELGLREHEQEFPRLVQRSVILILNTGFIGFNFSIKSRLFDIRKKNAGIRHPDLVEKIQSAMMDKELYRKEKLTIGQLAETLNEQEYKVRRVINQEMGYRNFIDFTNAYRIKEASGLLRDESKSDLTILEIAYKVGFNSIGPFNRTFKQSTGLTPTDFRKKHLHK